VVRRFDLWLDLAGDLLSHPSPFPRDLLMDRLHETFECSVSLSQVSTSGSFKLHMRDPIPGWPTPDLDQLWLSQGPRFHPLVRWYAVSGDRGAMSIGRVPSGVVEPGRTVVRDLLLPEDLEQQLTIPFTYDDDSVTAFVLAQPGPDFADEQFSLARRIQPLLTLLGRHFSTLAQTPRGTASLGLSEREIVVLDLLSRGLTAVAIGRRLSISPRTVQVHLRNIYRKLGVHDRLLAVQLYREATGSPP
jgi:DNA-binding CsgD family transcriptional regulator